MRRHASRSAGPILLALVVTALLPGSASAAVTWGPQRDVADWSWQAGGSLAATGSTIHALYTTDRVGGAFATDRGPYMGLFLVSSSDRGATWSEPTRVSQPQRHADRGALAASGDRLYAAWVTQGSYERFDPTAPRVLFFRANANAGGPNAWGPMIRLSKQKGRVDAPAVAAAGGRVFVAWTDAVSGDVRLAFSDDEGKTWTRKVVGKAKGSDPGGEGRVGFPDVEAGAGAVGVTWLATPDGAVKARISPNRGATWRPAVSLAASGGRLYGGAPSAAGAGGRLAFAWTAGPGLRARVWAQGAWSPIRQVASFTGGTYPGGYDAQVAITAAGRVGVAWSGCRTAGCDLDSTQARVDLLWSGSTDGGTTWRAPEIVRGSQQPDQRLNDGASALWLDADVRVILFDGWVPGYTTYRLFVRVGNGPP
ncbi:MAG TPA: sialidase family protein [Actinomycetota bacterium]